MHETVGSVYYAVRAKANGEASGNVEAHRRQKGNPVPGGITGLRPKSDCFGKAQKQFYSKLQTRPLVREGATK
jgi:hypothetical protein